MGEPILITDDRAPRRRIQMSHTAGNAARHDRFMDAVPGKDGSLRIQIRIEILGDRSGGVAAGGIASQPFIVDREPPLFRAAQHPTQGDTGQPGTLSTAHIRVHTPEPDFL